MSSPPPPVAAGPPTVDGPARSTPAGGAGVRSVLRVPAFRGLYVALGLSSAADWLGFLATTALAAQLFDSFSGRAYATGGVLVFRLLPAVLFGPVAGAFADRWDRKRTMVVGYVARFLLFTSIPVVGLVYDRGTATLVWLLAASFLIETFNAFWIPAKEATVPNIVSRDQLEAANQLTLVATYGTAPVAAVLFGLLSLVSDALGSSLEYFASGPVDLAFYATALAFLVSGVIVARLDLPSPSKAERAAQVKAGEAPLGVLASLREGLIFVGRTPLTRGIIIGMLGALAAGGAIIALGRLFAETVLGGGNAAYSLLFGSIFLGIALGVALGPRLLGHQSRRRAFGPSIVGAGLSLVVLATVPVLAVATLATVFVGAFAGLAYVVGITLLGLEVEDELRGRMFALVQSLMRIDLLLVTAAAPFLAGAIDQRELTLGPFALEVNGIAVLLLAGGLLAVTVGVLSFRQMDDRPGVPLRHDLIAMVRRTPPPPTHSGLFVAFEGGEGAGKTTQIAALEQWLIAAGHQVVVTREPGATPLGTRVRALLLDPDGTVAPRAEALLYAADRAQHVEQVVRPALDRGEVVVTDRYVDSSLAYQGAGRALEVDEVKRLSGWATGGLRPDLVVLLDIDPVVGLARAAGPAGTHDRMEAESVEFHQRVRQGFLDLAHNDPDRYLVVPADQPAEVVHEEVRERVTELLPSPAPSTTAGAHP